MDFGENTGKPHWYRLERPTGTKGAATLRQRGSLFGTGCLSNRYQWKPKAPVENTVSKGEAIGLGLRKPVGKPVPKGVSNRFPWRVF